MNQFFFFFLSKKVSKELAEVGIENDEVKKEKQNISCCLKKKLVIDIALSVVIISTNLHYICLKRAFAR